MLFDPYQRNNYLTKIAASMILQRKQSHEKWLFFRAHFLKKAEDLRSCDARNVNLQVNNFIGIVNCFVFHKRA